MRIPARTIGFTILLFACSSSAQAFHPDNPQVWDDKAVKDSQVPRCVGQGRIDGAAGGSGRR